MGRTTKGHKQTARMLSVGSFLLHPRTGIKSEENEKGCRTIDRESRGLENAQVEVTTRSICRRQPPFYSLQGCVRNLEYAAPQVLTRFAKPRPNIIMNAIIRIVQGKLISTRNGQRMCRGYAIVHVAPNSKDQFPCYYGKYGSAN